MLQKLRESLALVLLALLPFHALLVTVGTKLLLGPGHAPMNALALWKEGVLGIVLALACVEVVLSVWGEIRDKRLVISLRFDLIDGLIVALVLLAAIVTAVMRPDRAAALLGVRYDFVPLVAFLILRRVPWSEQFLLRLKRVLISVGAVVAVLGIASLFLPIKFLTALGYSDLHSLYVPGGPLAPFQQIEGSWLRRIQGPMSGPNQLGVWLLVPLSMVLASLLSEKGQRGQRGQRWQHYLFAFIAIPNLLALFLTFSRAAWLAAIVMAAVAFFPRIPKRIVRKVVPAAAGILLLIGIVAAVAAPSVFFRLSSSRGHLTRPLEAIGRMAAHPFGTGLGTAGPATNRISEPCVFLRPQDDPAWAKAQPQLCVFLGTTQVQPTDHVCKCPFLPENWYLQVGVELGVVGFVLYVVLVGVILRRLGMQNGKPVVSDVEPCKMQNSDSLCILHFAFLAFLGVSLAALFLHAWEDAAVAYSGWLLVAVALSDRKGTKVSP